VLEAAAIACKHPKWDERPLLVVVKRPGAELTREQMLGYFEGLSSSEIAESSFMASLRTTKSFWMGRFI